MEEAQTELNSTHHLTNVIEMPSALALYPALDTSASVNQAASVDIYPVPPDCDSLDATRMYIHSSGTTSLPKPIPLDERYMRYMGSSPSEELLRYVCTTLISLCAYVFMSL